MVQQRDVRVVVGEERARLAAVLGDEEGASNLLRQAQGLFGKVEATGHVERIAVELGA